MKIVSGGQTGADIAGLMAARRFGIETGGWMPPNFLTEYGSKPQWAKEFGLQAILPVGSVHAAYVARTNKNAQESDGTIIFSSDWQSKGTVCTIKAAERYKKPCLKVDFEHPQFMPTAAEVVDWIVQNGIQVLNVAGNRESKSPGITSRVTSFLSEVFRAMGFQETEKE